MNNTKEKIRDTALSLFMTRGYSVGINEIIEKSGTSKGSFYHHFKSKEDLFVETINHFFFGVRESRDLEFGAGMTLREKLMKIVERAYLPFKKIGELVPEGESLNYLKVISEYPDHESLRKKNSEHFKKINESTSVLIASAIVGGLLSKNVDANMLSNQICLLIDGSFVNAILISGNMKKAEEECKKTVGKLLDYIEKK
jgi:AcrR family transcriptional regulator